MSRQEDSLAAIANAAHEVPDGVARLRVEPGGELVEKDDLRIVDQCEGDEQALLLASREVHEPGRALVSHAELLEQTVTVDGLLLIKRCPEVDCLPHFDSLLQLRLLELNPDAVL